MVEGESEFIRSGKSVTEKRERDVLYIALAFRLASCLLTDFFTEGSGKRATYFFAGGRMTASMT